MSSVESNISYQNYIIKTVGCLGPWDVAGRRDSACKSGEVERKKIY